MFKRKLPIKTLFFLFVCVFVLSLAQDIPDSNAFLKDTDIKVPLTSVGDLKVNLVDEDGVGTLTLGATEARNVKIKNESDAAMFVRLLVHPTLNSAGGLQRVVDKEAVIQGISGDWIDGKDGYYYYKKKLSKGSGATTAPVFTKVAATPDMAATDVLTIHLKVEAITTKGTTYRDAWWEGQQPTSGIRPALQALDTALNTLKD